MILNFAIDDVFAITRDQLTVLEIRVVLINREDRSAVV